jgi:hypothetical protein
VLVADRRGRCGVALLGLVGIITNIIITFGGSVLFCTIYIVQSLGRIIATIVIKTSKLLPNNDD